MQSATPLVGAGHGSQRIPHEATALSARHMRPQRCVSGGQGNTHRPSMHVPGAGQGFPHAPQLAESIERSVQPARGQYDCEAEHEQRPPAHHEPALQVVPHAPQFCESVDRSTQRSPQAMARSAGQAHMPPRHTRPIPCGPQGVSGGSSSNTHTRAVGSQRSRTVQTSVSAHWRSFVQGRCGRHPRVTLQAEPTGQREDMGS